VLNHATVSLLVMQVAVVQVIDMSFVLDSLMTAAGAMSMAVLFVNRCLSHRSSLCVMVPIWGRPQPSMPRRPIATVVASVAEGFNKSICHGAVRSKHCDPAMGTGWCFLYNAVATAIVIRFGRQASFPLNR
jgi:hypothetical protein